MDEDSTKKCRYIGREECCEWSRGSTLNKEIIVVDEAGFKVSIRKRCFFQVHHRPIRYIEHLDSYISSDNESTFICGMYILFTNQIDPDGLIGPER